MLPGGIGFWEIMIILVVVLLVMGPAKIPEVARTLGKGIRAARRAGQEIRDAIDPDEYRRQFRAWEMNHHIDDGELETDSSDIGLGEQEPTEGDSTASAKSPTPSGVYGTVSRSDDSGPSYDEAASEPDPNAQAQADEKAPDKGPTEPGSVQPGNAAERDENGA